MSAMSSDVSRVGEPRLVHSPSRGYSPSRGSVKMPNEYKIATTPIPTGLRCLNWLGFFRDQLNGPLVALHDGNEITVYCDPDDCPNWLGLVDAAIEHANKQVGTISP
jgi:hypothetical protein